MDYVLFGMGYGATLMLLGWALRTFGPERKYKDVNPEDIDQTVLQRRWVRFIQGLGGVIAIAGTALVLFTFVIMLVNPDDETGAFISMVIWGFLAVAVLIWCWFYVAAYGVTGVWSRESGYRSVKPNQNSADRSVPSTSVVRSVSSVDRGETPEPALASVVDESEDDMSLADDAFTGGFSETASDHSLEADLVDEDSIDSHDSADVEVDATSEEAEPEYDFGDSTDTTVPSELGGRSEAIRRLRDRQARSGNTSS